MAKLLNIYQKLVRLPAGKSIFSWLVCRRAPYFASISPVITELTPNEIHIAVRKKRKVLNHIKTVHAIAMANACELAAGLLMEAGLPAQFRWIPKSMQINYLKKAETDVTAIVKIADWSKIQLGDNEVMVEVLDTAQQKVVEAKITMWISEKK